MFERRQVALWRKSCPRITPFYAVKCNDDLAVLAVLANEGVNFDCASKAEISKVSFKKVLQLSFSSTSVIFLYLFNESIVCIVLQCLQYYGHTYDRLDRLGAVQNYCKIIGTYCCTQREGFTLVLHSVRFSRWE